MNSKYKVIIIGAGPAGIAMALNLIKLDIKDILVIEKYKFPRYKCCAGYITNKTKKEYEKLGLNINNCHYKLIKDFKLYYKKKLKQTINNKFLYTNENIDRVELDYAFYQLLKEKSIILIEGLHALNDELMKGIDKKYKYKIYLSPFIPINIDRHNYISTLDLRLLRRIVRDNRTRGYNVSETIDSWQKVRNGEEKYIFPYTHQADIIINTALAYEVGVLKVYVEPLLYSVRMDSAYYAEARRLLNFLKQFYPIPSEYINDDSILREFIGGKNND